ncbi:hypothetical protein ABZV14_03020 [Streptosporangium canum]|uniref:hypothetical protein n=1 Tax=Streptosporangium TaxID=2000 RepID=UPI0004CDAA2B|nr:hypothetical protein [Streptosporangium roseum]
MDPQPVLCHTCTGVLLANDSRTYTPQRGRLIVTNGYCTCPPAAEAPAEPEAHRQQPQQQERLPGQATMVNV